MKKLTIEEQLEKGGFVHVKTHYYVNKKGQVASIRCGKLIILRQYSNRKGQPQKGYLFVNIEQRNPTYVHRLVWETFVGPIPAGYDIHHLQGKHNNCLENLQCVEASQHRREANLGRVAWNKGLKGIKSKKEIKNENN